MKRMLRVARSSGKVLLALLGGVLMPILIWVGLGVTVYHKVQERRFSESRPPLLVRF